MVPWAGQGQGIFPVAGGGSISSHCLYHRRPEGTCGSEHKVSVLTRRQWPDQAKVLELPVQAERLRDKARPLAIVLLTEASCTRPHWFHFLPWARCWDCPNYTPVHSFSRSLVSISYGPGPLLGICWRNSVCRGLSSP